MKRNPKDNFFVAIQFILLIAYLFRFSKIDFKARSWLQLIGMILAVGRIIILVASGLKKAVNRDVFPRINLRLVLHKSGGVFLKNDLHSGTPNYPFLFLIKLQQFSRSSFFPFGRNIQVAFRRKTNSFRLGH